MPIKKEKIKQLGMNPATASGRLNKQLLYNLGDRLGLQWCYHCATKIESVKDMSIEHKIPWLHSEDPVSLYFDLDNIAFSHKSCNYSSRRIRKAKPCPSTTAYRDGCRCKGCKEVMSKARKKRYQSY